MIGGVVVGFGLALWAIIDADGFCLLILDAFEVAEIGVNAEGSTYFLSGLGEVLVFIHGNHGDVNFGVRRFPEGDNLWGDKSEEGNDNNCRKSPDDWFYFFHVFQVFFRY